MNKYSIVTIAEVTSEHDVSPFDNLIRELRQTRNSKLQVIILIN